MSWPYKNETLQQLPQNLSSQFQVGNENVINISPWFKSACVLCVLAKFSHRATA
jgi:hypothetical protein